MLENLTRARAAILLALVALSLGWSLTVRPAQPEPGVIVDNTYDDRDLFREIATRVGEGDSYYLAATTLQRQHHYPTQPFVAVRPPTLTWLGVMFGWQAMHITLLALLGLAVAAWYPLFAKATRIERIAGALAIFIGGAHATQFEFVVWYEIWAGTLIAIALALRRGAAGSGCSRLPVSRWHWRFANLP